jgi:uncharacterized membrane protein
LSVQWILNSIFLAYIAGSLVWLFRITKQAAGKPIQDEKNKALTIAMQRFAGGHISREEFLRIKKDLG